MIRVNLMRNMGEVGKKAMEESTVSATIQFKTAEAKELPLIILKFVMVCVPVLGLYLYSSRIVDEKARRFKQINQEAATADAETAQLSKSYEELKGYKTDNENLNLLIGSIAGLSKRRTLVVRDLDHLQTLTPARVWFNEIKVSLNIINIKGMAVANDDVSDFIKVLSESAFFSHPETVKVEEIKKKYGSVRSFEINLTMETI